MTQNARDTILARIRAALTNAPETLAVPRHYRTQDERTRTAILESFIDRLHDYKALVTTTGTDHLPQSLADACSQHGIQRLIVPGDIPDAWVPPNVTALRDATPLSLNDLNNSDGVLTGCAIAIAQTGTIILNGGNYQGRRALSLIPDRHLCIVQAEQVVGLVPEAITWLAERKTHPITLISGPSATSDIELSRVEGVHGPRTLHVFIVHEETNE